MWNQLTITNSINLVYIKVKDIYKDLLDWYRSSDIVVCKVLEDWSEAPKMQSIQLDEGLMIIEEAIQKAKKIVEGYPETKFTTEEYTKFHAYP